MAGKLSGDLSVNTNPFEVAEDLIENIDRKPDANAKGTYTFKEKYSTGGKNQPGQRIPKAGVSVGAGVGYAEAHAGIFAADAKGPNACAGAGVSALTGAKAMARAEIASASASAGPLKAKVGLGVDTGASIGPMGAEVKFLGTGIKIGPETSISLLGNEVSCCIQ